MESAASRVSPLVNWGTLECVYPKYPDVEDLNVSENDRNSWLDLRPYIDNAAYTVNEHASILRTYRMFRTLGLRHLCVINQHNNLLGIITRANLASIHSDDPSIPRSKGGKKDSPTKEYLRHTIDVNKAFDGI